MKNYKCFYEFYFIELGQKTWLAKKSANVKGKDIPSERDRIILKDEPLTRKVVHVR